MLKDIVVPTFQQIAAMSFERCRQERTRLKNEISFARGNALWGGPSAEADIASYKHAIDMIEQRLHKPAPSTDEAGKGSHEAADHRGSNREHGWWEDTASYGM